MAYESRLFIVNRRESTNWNPLLGKDVGWVYGENIADIKMSAMRNEEFYADTKPTEFLNRVYYGHDEGDGDKSEFCPNRNYFRYNGYGNLVSADFKDYSDHLDDYFIDELARCRKHIDSIDDDDELKELFDMLEAEDSEDDEE